MAARTTDGALAAGADPQPYLAALFVALVAQAGLAGALLWLLDALR